MELINGGITNPKGFLAAGTAAGIRKKEKKDVALVYSESLASAAVVYTLNKFKAAPLQITAQNLKDKKAQAIVVNSGVANACMGEEGLKAAQRMAEIAGKRLDISMENVIVASTGVIGIPVPLDIIEKGINTAAEGLSLKGGPDAAEAIMTTDLVKKEAAIKITIGEKEVTIGGMAKGSGMIHPNMATMLSFLTTDADIDEACLQVALTNAVSATFNMISVDGDTSTNDMVVILANGMAENEKITADSEYFKDFQEAVLELCTILAKKIAQDGEGATKLIETEVIGAISKTDARKAARSICSSSLVKSAMFGEDANWGRIVTALGYSEAEIDPMLVDVFIGDLLMAENGSGLAFDEDKAAKILQEKEVKITVNLKLGEFSAKAWGCDLSYDYVRINADYRS